MKLSERSRRISPSAIRRVAEKAADMKTAGIDVVSLSAGEPDFPTPDIAIRAAQDAMARGETHYSPSAGIAALRQEVAKYYAARFGVSYDPAQVIVSSGAKPILFHVLASLIDPGDEVIVITPAWVSYVEQIRFLGGSPVLVPATEATFEVDIAAVRAAVTGRTVAILVNCPNNPTGAIYAAESVAALCHLAMERGLTIVNDEVYERIVYTEAGYRNPVAIVPEARGHVININSASKTFAMTGWRIGYALGPKELIGKLISLQSHALSGAATFSQFGAVAALKQSDGAVADMLAEYRARRDIVARALAAMPLIRFHPPAGAFYAFVDIRGALGGAGGIRDDIDFCERLLDRARVAAVPGTAFMLPGHIRLSFATARDRLEIGLARLGDFLQDISDGRHDETATEKEKER